MALLILATGGVVPLVAQTPSRAAGSLSSDRPAPADTTPDAATLRGRWGEPFAVVSVGRPVPRPPREVVVAGTPAEPTPAPEPAAPEPPVMAKKPSASAPSAARTHRVEWGETFYGIARQNDVSIAELKALNPDVDPEHLRSGEVLRLPAARKGSTRSYTVTSGDTLWGIAHHFGVSAEALRKANDLKGDVVRVGQTLIIPQGE